MPLVTDRDFPRFSVHEFQIEDPLFQIQPPEPEPQPPLKQLKQLSREEQKAQDEQLSLALAKHLHELDAQEQ